MIHRVVLLNGNVVFGCAIVADADLAACTAEWTQSMGHTVLQLADTDRPPNPGDTWNGTTFDPRVPDLEEVRANALAILDLERDEAYGAGYEFPPGAGTRVSLEAEARDFAGRLWEVAKTDSTLVAWPVQWPTVGRGSFVTIPDVQTAQALYFVQSQAIQALENNDLTRRAAVKAATTVDAIRAIVPGA